MRDASKATYMKCKSEEGLWSMLEGQGLYIVSSRGGGPNWGGKEEMTPIIACFE